MGDHKSQVEGILDQYDLLVIGGGITGAGVARDAALRGMRVCLAEQEDLAYGTSSRSSKLVHGGLRYLEQGEISLVFDAVAERRVLMDIAPHLVNPLAFLFPVYKASRRGVFTVNVGMWLYDGLSLFRSPKIHRNLSRREVREAEPQLDHEGLKGAPLYYDCSTDDSRLTLETALSAVRAGATVLTYHRVVGLVNDTRERVVGARLVDRTTGREREIRAHAVINATGPWTDAMRSLGQGVHKPLLRPTKGVHLVVDAARLPVRHAVVCFHPRDGRVLFAIPWGERTYIGTTDTDSSGDPGEVCATAEDVAYLLEVTNRYFPGTALVPDDVIATWAGVRPLIVDQEAESESAVSREHAIHIDRDGLITIAGGKLTTYRRMAAEVVDKALGLLMLVRKVPPGLKVAHTDREPLPGAVGWPADDDHELVTRQVLEAGGGAVDAATARNLGDTYGMRGMDVARLAAADADLQRRLVPGRPEIMAQVDWAVRQELAVSVRDVLVRRMPLYFKDADQGLGCCDAVAARMAALLGWDEERTLAEVLAYQEEVARCRRWRETPPVGRS